MPRKCLKSLIKTGCWKHFIAAPFSSRSQVPPAESVQKRKVTSLAPKTHLAGFSKTQYPLKRWNDVRKRCSCLSSEVEATNTSLMSHWNASSAFRNPKNIYGNPKSPKGVIIPAFAMSKWLESGGMLSPNLLWRRLAGLQVVQSRQCAERDIGKGQS